MFRSGITTTYTLYLWDPVRSFRFRWQMHVPIPANGKRPWPCFLDMNLLMTFGGSEIYSQKNSNNSILELPDPRMHPRNLNVEVMRVALMLIWGQLGARFPSCFLRLSMAEGLSEVEVNAVMINAAVTWPWYGRRWGQWRGAYRFPY